MMKRILLFFSICVLSCINAYSQATTCLLATSLTSGVATAGSNVLGVASTVASSCQTTTKEVWYKITIGGSGSIAVNVTFGTMVRGGVSLYSGTCGSLTELGCNSSKNGPISISAISCLNAGTYYIKMWTYTGTGSTSGTFTITATYAAGPGAPTNDACANATNLGTVSTSTTTTGTNVCASADQSSNCVTPVENVWYKFTVPASGGSYAISVTDGTIAEAAISVYSGTCGSLTSLNCGYGDESVNANCLAAGTYYINVDDDFGTAGTFSITVTQTSSGASAPANDACAGAINLGTVSTTTTTTGNNLCATADKSSTCVTPVENVWYKFTVPASGGSYAISVAAGTIVDPAISVYSGTCGGLTNVNCGYGGESVNANCLAAGTYFINVDDDFGSAGTFSITVTQVASGSSAPTNDACANAISLGTVSTTTTTTGNNLCATADKSSTCVTPASNVWYTFTVPAGGGSYLVSVTGGTIVDPAISVYSGTCASLTNVNCTYGNSTNASVSANCLAAGTYFINVDDDFGSPGTFSITVTQVASGSSAPANDACANAISLGTVSTTTTTAGSNLCATADKSSTCVTPVSNVWYTFTVPAGGGSYAISVTGGTIVDPAISVYSGTCASLTNVNCTYGNSTNASISASCLAAGTYYINVDDDFGSPGTFSITVTQTLAGTISVNDNCSGATSFTVGNCVNGDVSCATQSQAGCTGTANDDIWYSFTATSTSIEINVAASASFDPVVQIFSGACASLTNKFCEDLAYTSGSSGCKTFAGFTVGTKYYIRVYDYGTGVPATTTFTMCVAATTTVTEICNLNYSYSSIATNIESGVTNTIPGISDDILSSAVPIGFTFCYDGYQYSQVYVSSNAALVFDAVDPCSYPNVDNPRVSASNGAATGYSIAGPIPYSTTSDYTPANAILGPWHDIDVANGGTITYAVLGTAPNRRFIVYFNAVHQFESASPCQNAGYEFTGQMKLFETTNNIEIHVQNQKSCTQWNNGQAILGLQNAFGTMAVVPTGYNANASSPYNQYSITNSAWQFTTPCTSCVPIVLPIQIISFTGALNGKVVELKWNTASETNNAYFTIDRSIDGKNFEELGRVNGAGNSTQTLNYSTTDNSPLTGVSYYRLSQTDFNGNTTRFNIIAINNSKDDDGKFTAIPNPTEGIVTISYSCDISTVGTLKLYDGNGALVLSKDIACTNGKNTSQLDVSEITAGIYIITFNTDTKFYRTKLMKR